MQGFLLSIRTPLVFLILGERQKERLSKRGLALQKDFDLVDNVFVLVVLYVKCITCMKKP